MHSNTSFSRVPPAPNVISQLYADYKRAADGLPLSFGDYLKVIGFTGGKVEPEQRSDPGRESAAPRSTIPSHPVKGSLRIIVLLVDFADNPGRRPARQFEDMLFSRQAYLSGSMREFFHEVSQGEVDVVGTVHGWMRMPEPYTYYVSGRSGTGPYPRNAQRLAEHALAAAVRQGVDFDPQLDKFGNQRITGLFIVHAGMGAEVMPSVADQKKHIWSHKHVLRRPFEVSDTLAADTYLTVPEDANMGVCAHELGHLAFQWDDFYDPDQQVDGHWAGAGSWDLMAAGSWNNGGVTPAHPAGLHKAQHGWVLVKDVSASGHLVLPPYGEPNAIVVRIKGRRYRSSQSLILENRRTRGFDQHLPGTGLLVWRVDTSLEMGDATRAAMMLIQADGKRELELGAGHKGDAGDPFPGSANRTELLDSGVISTSFAGQGPSGVSLHNIVLDPATGVVELDVRIALTHANQLIHKEINMTTNETFAPQRLLLKESTAHDFEALGIGPAGVQELSSMPPMPSAFSIRDEMTPVENQGQQGSCTSFCVASCLEHLHRRDFSEGQITHEAEKAFGDCTEGLAMVHAYQICKSPGSVDEQFWPYDAAQVCWTTPPDLSNAPRYRFSEIGYVYQRPRAAMLAVMSAPAGPAMSPGLPLSVAVQQQLFARRKPISVAVPVVWSAWPWNGTVSMPSPAALAEFTEKMSPPNVAGWHCIAVCGWDNSTGRFLFKNSWGSWGDQGYGTIPYQYLEMYSDVAMVGW